MKGKAVFGGFRTKLMVPDLLSTLIFTSKES